MRSTNGGPLPSRPGAPDRTERAPLPTSLDGLPPLDDSFALTLDAGLLALGLELDLAQRAAIDGHIRLLVAWNEHINLTSIREPAAIAREHVLDSLSAVSVLRRRRVARLADIGSGGGFPGLPLAVALPDVGVTLVESTRKKASFLDAAVGVAGVGSRVAVLPQRAEALAQWRGLPGFPVDAVTARAVASLDVLAALAAPLLAPGGTLVAWKRGDVAAEIAGARQALARAGFGRPEVVPVDVPGLGDHRLVLVPLEQPRGRLRG